MGKKYIVGGTFIIYCRQLAEELTQKAICSVLILQRMKKLETESHFGLVNPCIKLIGYTEQEITKSLELSKEFYLWENTFFDYDDGNFAHTISDNMAIDSDGDLLMRMGDNMAMDMDSGELHIISGWPDDEDDD